MKSFTVLAFASVLATVSAQFPNLPTCALLCATKLHSTGATKCSLLDIKCQCADTAFQAKSAECFQTDCTAPGDLEKALVEGAAFCLQNGVTVVLPGPTPTPTPTPETTPTPEPTTEEEETTPVPTTTDEEEETTTEPPVITDDFPETTTTLVTVTKCPVTTTDVVVPPPATNGTNTTVPAPVPTAPDSSAAGLRVGGLLIAGAFAAVFAL